MVRLLQLSRLSQSWGYDFILPETEVLGRPMKVHAKENLRLGPKAPIPVTLGLVGHRICQTPRPALQMWSFLLDLVGFPWSEGLPGFPGTGCWK